MVSFASMLAVTSRLCKYCFLLAFGGALLLPRAGQAQSGIPGWPGYSADSRHTARAPAAAQSLQRIHWSTSVDLLPQYSGSDLLIHYGTPLVTRNNTVIVTVKVGATDGFQVEGHRADTGTTLWTQPTDYSVPEHDWTPSCGCTLTPDNKLIIPAAGGTVFCIANPDQATPTVTRLAFYGFDSYNADTDTYNTNVQICTPITSDSQGNLYFGFLATASAPAGLQSGIARISATGEGTWTPAGTAAGDTNIQRVVYNCAPALSNDGSTVYVAVSNLSSPGFGVGYLLALDSATLAPLSKALLQDPKSGYDALLPDAGTASPTVGPDGDVYFGVLEDPFPSNNDRGWLLHFSGDLSQTKIPGAFGWDDTASIVPAAAVPSYTGASSYLLLTKYNNYAGLGGDGVNRVAVLDPGAMETDPVTGECVMQEVLTVVGPTPDSEYRSAIFPNAVREWCINSAAIDPITKCALVNSEDGTLYRWDFTTNTLSEAVVLTSGVGEAYTPTIVGPDGTVYAISDATLFAVGTNTAAVSGAVTLQNCVNSAQPLTFEFRPTDGSASFTLTSTLNADGTFILDNVPCATYTLAIKGGKWLQSVIPVDASGGNVSGVTATLLVGDVNGDNQVSLADYVLLRNAFGSKPGSSNWNPNADLNCDGQVSLADYVLLRNNFGKRGDP